MQSLQPPSLLIRSDDRIFTSGREVNLLSGFSRGDGKMYGEALFRGLKRTCPNCLDGRLHWRNWKHWRYVSRDGRRFCDHIVYYECDRCHGKVKIFRGGLIRNVNEQEWEESCELDHGREGSL